MDGQGNIRFVTDSSGAKLRSTEYDPFGNWRAANGQSNIQMLYQGQQQDPESNLYYLRARYYDTTTGRFISKDPVEGTLGNTQSQNGYNYANDNPVNLSDPSGRIVYNNSDQTILVKEENEQVDTYSVLKPNSTYTGAQDGVIFRDGSIYKNNTGVNINVANNGISNASPLDSFVDATGNVIKAGINAVNKCSNRQKTGAFRII